MFLSATAPSNPFNQAVLVVFDNLNLALPYKSRTDTNRATLGGTVRLPHHWAAGFDYTWNWARSTASFYGGPIDQVGFQCAKFGIISSNVGTGLNQCNAVFGAVATDPRAPINVLTNPDFSAFVSPRPTDTRAFSSSLRTPSFRLSGPLFGLPAGPVNFSGLAQRNIARTNLGYQQVDTYGAIQCPILRAL